MPVDWMQEFQDTVKQDDTRKQGMADQNRQRILDNAKAVQRNIDLTIAHNLDPDNPGQPLKGKEQAVSQLRQHRAALESYLNRLANPKFNPETGQIAEDPIHKLTDKLHLTKPPAENKTAGEQMKDLSDIRAKYATEPSLLTPEEQKQAARVNARIEAPAANEKAGTDFNKFLVAYAKRLGKDSSELSAEEMSAARHQWMASGRSEKEKLVPDPESETGYSAIGYDAQGNEAYRVKNVVPPRSATGRETTQTDPFGVTTTTVSKPVFPGKQGNAATPAAKPETKTPKKPGEQIRDLKGISSKNGPKQLDAQGHIPPDAKANPQLREAANNLLDGMSVKDLQVPEKDKTAAQKLARDYGWAGQGMFTPRDKLLVRESQAILTQFSKDPALAVLDDATSRVKLMQVLANPEKRSMVGQTLQVLTAGGLSPQEQQFVTLYNQAVGRISGLSQLVRSGRPTEATIERLKTELPNPATTASSEHARQKFAQLQNEIDIALQKGQFSDQGQGDIQEIVDALKGKTGKD